MKDAQQITDELNKQFAVQNELERQKDEARARRAALGHDPADEALLQFSRLAAAWEEAAGRMRNLHSRLVGGQNPRGELHAIGRLREQLAAVGLEIDAVERLVQAKE